MQEEANVKQWILDRAEQGISTLGKDIFSFICLLTQGQVKPNKGAISKLCKQLKISSKTQKKRTEKQMRSTYSNEVEKFVN